MARKSVFDMKASVVYEALAAKAEKHGRTREELDALIERLLGYRPDELHEKLDGGCDYASLFRDGHVHPAADSVTGTVCGVKVQDVEDPLMRRMRVLDLMVDRLAKGRDALALLPEEPVQAEPVPVMIFEIDIDGRQINGFESPEGSVTFIPFTGRTSSPLFTGEIMPGAADVQTEKPGEARVLCARYLFRGTDRAGKSCSLYVENVGRVTEEPGPLCATPVFLTDSEALGAYLAGKTFRSEVHGREGGVRILIFEDERKPVT